MTTSAIRINIKSALDVPMISNVGVYKTAEAFSMPEGTDFTLPTNLSWLDIDQFATTGSWGNDSFSDGTKGKYTSANNGEATFSFTGTKAWLYGTKDPNHGKMDVYVDGALAGKDVNTQASTRTVQTFLWETPDLEYGEHTVRIVRKTAAIGLWGAYYENGSGIFEMDQELYEGEEGDVVNVKIVRKLGSSGEATVYFDTPSRGAEQGVNYQYMDSSVTFEDGETEKTVPVQLNHSTNIAEGLTFFFRLKAEETQASLGACATSTVVIHDIDAKPALEQCLQEYAPYIASGADYGTDKWQKFANAYEAAKAAAEDASVMTVITLKNNLEYAFADFAAASAPQIKEELTEGIQGYESYLEADASKYDADKWKEFADAYKEAQAVTEDTPALTAATLKSKLDQAFSALFSEEAKDNLRQEVAKYDAYKNLDGKNYNAAKWQAFADAYKAASKAGEDADGARMVQLQKALNDAYAALMAQSEADLSEKVTSMASKFNGGGKNYTTTTWQKFYGAYIAAKNPPKNADAAKLTELRLNLDQAYAKLTLQPADKAVALAAPSVTKLASSVTGVKITFSASPNSSSYEIYRKKGSGQPVKIGATAQTSFTDENPAGGSAVTYMVRAISGNAAKYTSSGYGTGKTITLPQAPKKITVKAQAKGIKITVQSSKKASQYVILRSEKKDSGYKAVKKLKWKKKATYIDMKVKKGKKYYYRVVAVKSKSYSPAKTSKVVKCKK